MALLIDTDLYKITRELRETFLDALVPHGDDCLLYPSEAIYVPCRGYKHPIGVSPARLAWRLAHPEDHLGVRDLAVHVCAFGTNHRDGRGDPRVCCNAAHLRKGTIDDVSAMKRVRPLIKGEHP